MSFLNSFFQFGPFSTRYIGITLSTACFVAVVSMIIMAAKTCQSDSGTPKRTKAFWWGFSLQFVSLALIMFISVCMAFYSYLG